MKAVFFAAGLGDFIRVCYQTNSYTLLSETQEMVTVVLALHNPYAAECFYNHPHRSFLRVIDLPGQYELQRGLGLRGEELHHALMRIAGVDPKQIASQKIPSKPVFHAEDEVEFRGHVVIQPFASTPDRAIPEQMLTEIVMECANTGRQLHIATRSYSKQNEKGRLIHGPEELPPRIARHPAVVWHRNLSVPATINLVKNCALFVGSHSAMLQAAWHEGRTVHALYPKGHVDWTAERLGKGYTFGANFDSTVHQNFKDFSIERLRAQLAALPGHQPTGFHPGSRIRFLRGSSGGFAAG